MRGSHFTNYQEISANENYSIFKAIRGEDSQAVILKQIKDSSKRKNLRERLLNEREIAAHISKPWTNRILDWIEEPDVILVFLDRGEITLRQSFQEKIGSTAKFLEFAISISQKLLHIHEKKILHRDIKPSNILYDKISGDYFFIDFGLSRKYSRNFVEENRSILEGTPEFISPESTGRTGNTEDYRSDLYSLGITFYEILTGRLPFLYSDPLKLIHAHLAIPATFTEDDKNVIPILKKIILKLLEKSPAKRYQSAGGLLHDLQKIQTASEKDWEGLDFTLGEIDGSMDFIIPKKLYGREKEISHLLQNFEFIKKGETRTTLIGGYSGIGKSALINVLQAPISEERGFFLGGKFEQYKQNIPFSAIFQALKVYVRLIILNKEEITTPIKEKLKVSMGDIGGVITKVLPEFEVLLGMQKSLPELPPSQESNRFQLALERLFLCITGEIPIILFLDDMQWADSASLEVLKNLLPNPELKKIYFLFAYRDNEVDETHPFQRMITNLQKEDWNSETILIKPLEILATNELVSDALRRNPEDTKELSQIIQSRTEGNPFFLHQILYSIYDKNGFVLQNNQYMFSLSSLSMLRLDDSVVDLMLSRIEKLPPESRELLSAASCMGSSVEVSLLSRVLQNSNLPQILMPIMEEGFFIKNKYFRKEEEIIELKFGHDRIQQASYQRWENTQKEAIHYQTGRFLLEEVRSTKERLFEFLEQWNSCTTLLSEEEKKELFKRNLEGARQAKSSTAYEGCLQFLKNAFELEKNIEIEEESLLELYLERGEAESLNFHYEEGEVYFQKALILCKTRLDRLKVYEKMVYFLSLQGSYDKSIEKGIEICKEFNDKISLQFKKSDLFNQYKELQKITETLDIDHLISKKNQDEEIELYFKIINIILNSAYYSNIPYIIDYLTIYSILVLFDFGLTKSNINLFSALAIYLTINKKHKLSVEIIKFLENKFQYMIYTIHLLVSFTFHNYFILDYKLEIERKNLFLLLEVGDFDLLGTISYVVSLTSFMRGSKIKNLKNESNLSSKILKKYNFIIFYNHIKQFIYFIDYLESNSDIIKIDSENNSLKSLNIYLLVLYKYRSNKEIPTELLIEFNKYRESIKYSYIETEFDFYHALILLRSSRESEDIYYQHAKKIQTFLRIFEEKAELCPENNLHKLLLIQAELAYTQKEYWTAMDLYDKSIASAKEFGFLNNSTLALERATIFYEEINKPLLMEAYLLEAIRENELWGATGRVETLKKKLPRPAQKSVAQTDPYPSHSSQTTTQVNIDSLTIIKATRILSEERSLNLLLQKFLEIILENSGAECALYLEYRGNTWFPLLSTNKESNTEYPHLPLRFIEKTRESLVLNYASLDLGYSSDEYYQKRDTKSVLVLPIVYKGELIGSVYMENNLSEGIFTKERVGLLGVLGSGAASFIENARSFQKVEDLSLELKRQNEILEEQKERATRAYMDLEVSQRQLIQADKMITLGTMVAGVAHEINTPLGAMKASGENIQLATSEVLDSIESLFSGIDQLGWGLVRSTVQIAMSGNKTLSSKEQRANKKKLKEELEKYPNLDTDTYAESIMELGLYEKSEIYEKLLNHPQKENLFKIILYYYGIQKKSNVVQISSERVSKIVKSLKSYMHFDTSDEMKGAHLPESIETVLTILHSKLKQGIEVTTQYGEMPYIYCYADELGQIFTNLIHNSIQAMEGKGTLNIEVKLIPIPDKNTLLSPFPPSTEKKEEFTELYQYEKFISISIEDNGPGIPPEIQKKIFEPFFTTKRAGEGSGLGLHIIHKILDKHAGYLELYSVPGCTRFTVLIPARVGLRV